METTKDLELKYWKTLEKPLSEILKTINLCLNCGNKTDYNLKCGICKSISLIEIKRFEN